MQHRIFALKFKFTLAFTYFTKDTEERTLSTSIWPTNKNICTRLHLEYKPRQNILKVSPTLNATVYELPHNA